MEELKFEAGKTYRSIPVIAGQRLDFERPVVKVLNRLDDSHINVEVILYTARASYNETVETKMIWDNNRKREYFPIYNGDFMHSVYASHVM